MVEILDQIWPLWHKWLLNNFFVFSDLFSRLKSHSVGNQGVSSSVVWCKTTANRCDRGCHICVFEHTKGRCVRQKMWVVQLLPAYGRVRSGCVRHVIRTNKLRHIWLFTGASFALNASTRHALMEPRITICRFFRHSMRIPGNSVGISRHLQVARSVLWSWCHTVLCCI